MATRIHLAETKALVSSGKVVISLADLPPNRRIRQILLSLDLTFVVAGTALATALLSDIQTRIIDSIRIGKRVRSTGLMMSYMDWMMVGKDFNRPADVPVTASTTSYRRVEVMIPYADLKAVNPDDTSPNTEFFRNTPIELGFANLSTLLPEFAKYTSVTGTLRTLVFHDEADSNVVPSSVMFNYDDWSQRTLYLPPGNYTHMFLYNEDGSAITDANMSDLSLMVDGVKYYDQIRPGELATFWNYYAADGVTLRDTAGVGAEAVEMGGSSAIGSRSFYVVPLIFQSDKFKLSKVISPERNIRLDVNGNASSLRVAYRLVENRSAASVAKAAATIGIPNARARSIVAKTVSKKASVAPGLLRRLPIKFGK